MTRKIVVNISRQTDKSDPLTEFVSVSVHMGRYTREGEGKVALALSRSIAVTRDSNGEWETLAAAGKAVADIIAYIMDHRRDI